MKENFIFPEVPEEEEGYGYICDVRDLRAFVSKIMSIGSQNVHNALIFGLCTSLRHANIRNMGRKHLQKKEDGSYAIVIPKNEMKVKKNGDFVLGLPLELAVWLEKIAESQPDDSLFFPNPMTHKPYSETTLRKNVEFMPQFSPSPKKIVIHSFRHTMSTLVNEERDDENNNVSISADDVERALAHKKPKMQKNTTSLRLKKQREKC